MKGLHWEVSILLPAIENLKPVPVTFGPPKSLIFRFSESGKGIGNQIETKDSL
jgi:hypothetical protein